MTIAITCPCGKRLQISEQYAGQQGQCPSCGKTLDIPRYGGPDDGEAFATNRTPTVQEIPASREEKREQADESTGHKRVSTEEGPWRPPEGMNDHGGRSIIDQADFFVDPPKGIGEILSAYTSLKVGVEPTSAAARTAWVLGLGGGGLLLGGVLGILTEHEGALLVIGLIVGVTAAIIAFYATRFQHRCSYIGSQGVARFLCSGNRANVEDRVFRFREAAELRVTQTRRFVNGAYQGTDYAFAWADVAGRPVYRISGTYKSLQGNPPSSDSYHFAAASELSWSNYMLGQIRPQLISGGTIFFGLGGGDWVRLGEGKIVLCFKGQTTDCDVADIAEVRIQQGWFEVRRKDAVKGWFSSTGIFKFPYGNLGNAQLFLFLMDRHVGIRVNG
jgi:hypothetical protein